MEPKVTSQNTKKQILEAYNELLENIQEEEKAPEQEKKEKSEKATVEKAGKLSPEKIYESIASLKSSVNNTLEDAENKMKQVFDEFENLKNAVAIEKKQLEEVYQISANADSLNALLQAQKKKKETFEEEMEQKKAQWEAEEKEKEKQRQREEEDYQYNLKKKRQKEQDAYEEKKEKQEKELKEKKVAFEAEISEREARVKAAEEELAELRTKAAEFPKILEKEIEKARKETTEALKKEFEFEKKLEESNNNADIKLKDQVIESLKEKNKELQQSLGQLSQKAVTAEEGLKEIAMKALESPSKERFSKQVKEQLGDE